MGIAGIGLSLGLLIYFAYRGVSLLVLAPALALLAAAISGAPLLASYTQVFMTALGGFVALYFPLFLLGALFGKLMEATGCARAIAHFAAARLGGERAPLAVVLACAALTYGGVSLFVVAFTVFPVAAALFREADVPRRLIPATIALGAFTFTMTALPGTPAIQNAIPMPYFDTTPFAAPGLGLVGAAVMLAVGWLWLDGRVRAARTAGEGFGAAEAPPPSRRALRERAQGEGYDVMEIGLAAASRRAPPTPGAVAAASPIVLVIALNWLFAEAIIPALDAAYLAEPRYGATTLASVKGVWAIVCALALACVFTAVVNRRFVQHPAQALDDGANAAVAPILNTASLVGFGAAIASLPAFGEVRDAVLGIAPGNPLISLSVAVNVLAGITGSASGGMSVALETLGESYLELARAAGVHPELLHRVTSIATGGLDALPHNGAVVTLLSICRLSHREAYLDIFVVAVAGPILSLATVVLLGTLFGSF